MLKWPWKKKSLQTVGGGHGWWRVAEPFSGAWQRNISYERKHVLCYHAVFACVTLIASDISKLAVSVVKNQDGIWVDVPFGKYSVLENPNTYQTRIQFFESWILSKLIRGNTYVFKQRDARGNVIGLHVLHPDRVLPMVSDDGQVFYQVSTDNLSGIHDSGMKIPASEIIHDRFNCFYHPLVGLSPLYACGLPAFMGAKILENSVRHFENGVSIKGILTVPEGIDPEEAKNLGAVWKQLYGGENGMSIATISGDAKFQPITMTAVDAQVIEQMKMTAEMVCSAYHVPPYKIGVGAQPSYNNVQALNVEYYNSALQTPISALELLLREGLDLPEGYAVNIEEEGLMRMDTKSQIESLAAAVGGGIDTPNEARAARNKKPIEGGDTVYLQVQNYSLSALAKRDAKENPFESSSERARIQIETAQPQQNGAQAAAADSGTLQQEALNGAQVTALQGIIFAVASGQLPMDAARALISSAFPLISSEMVEIMLSSAQQHVISQETPKLVVEDDEGKSTGAEFFSALVSGIERELSHERG